MKTRIFGLLLILFAVLIGGIISGCSASNAVTSEKAPQQESKTRSLVGTWVSEKYDISLGGPEPLHYVTTVTFYKDGTMSWNEDYVDNNHQETGPSDPSEGQWSLGSYHDQETLSIQYGNSTDRSDEYYLTFIDKGFKIELTGTREPDPYSESFSTPSVFHEEGSPEAATSMKELESLKKF